MPSKDPSGYARHAILCFQVAWDRGAQWFLPPWDSEEHGSARSQDCRKALFFLQSWFCMPALKWCKIPVCHRLFPVSIFCLVSLGLVHGILPLAAVTDVRLGWEQSEADG